MCKINVRTLIFLFRKKNRATYLGNFPKVKKLRECSTDCYKQEKYFFQKEFNFFFVISRQFFFMSETHDDKRDLYQRMFSVLKKEYDNENIRYL